MADTARTPAKAAAAGGADTTPKTAGAGAAGEPQSLPVAGVDYPKPDLVAPPAAEAAPGQLPDAGGNELLAAAQLLAPSLTQEFIDQYGLTDEDLAAIARGEVPPPPTVGPIHNVDLHRTPGGWQVTPAGVAPGDVGKHAISR